MSHVIALDLNGHLVEIKGSFETYIDAIKYLHNWYNSYKDLNVYIIHYTDEIADGGSRYQFNMSTYYSCEDGIYYEEHYDEIDQGQGLKEIGSTYLVNNDLLPQDLKDDGELVEITIEKWINEHYTNSNPPKPIWLI